MFKLKNEEASIEIAPDCGGGLLSFSAFGHQVLRPSSANETSPTGLAAFVLVPYCNRLATHTAFDGYEFQLNSTLAGEEYPLHGEGWIAPWQIENVDKASATLSFTHSPQGGHWPWRFCAEQKYALVGATLTHMLSIHNLTGNPMPIGLGFHPYFEFQPTDRFYANVDGVWESDAENMPTKHRALDKNRYWADGLLKNKNTIDQCFSGWDRCFRVERPALTIQVHASDPLNHLHVYAPHGEQFLCVEPVSHPPNALNLPGAQKMHLLQPDEVFSATMTYQVTCRD